MYLPIDCKLKIYHPVSVWFGKTIRFSFNQILGKTSLKSFLFSVVYVRPIIHVVVSNSFKKFTKNRSCTIVYHIYRNFHDRSRFLHNIINVKKKPLFT